MSLVIDASTIKSPPNSLITRLSVLLSRRSGHIRNHYIDLEDPVRQYGPGDKVSGKVILDVAGPLGITHVVIRLYGFVQVFKSHTKAKTTLSKSGGPIAKGRGNRWVSQYYGDGFASLFEEEIILCGQGRLDPRVYHFQFEVYFPTNVDLPTSIDFERGTISYIVSSTITRPTTITPTATVERKVQFRNDVEVGSLPAPRPCVVTLEPIERGNRVRDSAKRLTSSTAQKVHLYKPTTTLTESSDGELYLNDSHSRHQPRDDASPITTMSVSDASSAASKPIRGSEYLSSPRSNSPHVNLDTATNWRNSAFGDTKSISVSVQLSSSGCLPGEIVPLTIKIEHVKLIRNLNGIIVTLYRQSRVDMHPNLPISCRGKGGKVKYEELYPRSRTGLGGLSLSAAGSSQTWRKDLSQTFSPLYVDDRTMSAEIKVDVRVPDEAIPSIRTIGEMILIQYFVEVIVDIHGKLASPIIPSMTGVRLPMTGNAPIGSISEENHSVSTWGTNCLDTTIFRRDSNAVVFLIDLTVGTRDSAKARDNQEQEPQGRRHWTGSEAESSGRLLVQNTEEQDACYTNTDRYGLGHNYDDHYQVNYTYNFSEGSGVIPHCQYHYEDYQEQQQYRLPSLQHHPVVPLPDMLAEQSLPEKERLRRAEARLLPSQPPGDYAVTMDGNDHAPTAPYLPHEGC